MGMVEQVQSPFKVVNREGVGLGREKVMMTVEVPQLL